MDLTSRSLEEINEFASDTMISHIGMEFTEIGKDFLKAKMPVDQRTKQPQGLLHGGASASMAETLGSMASQLLIDHKHQFCVGIELNINHIKSAREGFVHGKVTSIHLGKTFHVWDIRINNDEQQLVSVARLTVTILNK